MQSWVSLLPPPRPPPPSFLFPSVDHGAHKGIFCSPTYRVINDLSVSSSRNDESRVEFVIISRGCRFTRARTSFGTLGLFLPLLYRGGRGVVGLLPGVIGGEKTTWSVSRTYVASIKSASCAGLQFRFRRAGQDKASRLTS